MSERASEWTIEQLDAWTIESMTRSLLGRPERRPAGGKAASCTVAPGPPPSRTSTHPHLSLQGLGPSLPCHLLPPCLPRPAAPRPFCIPRLLRPPRPPSPPPPALRAWACRSPRWGACCSTAPPSSPSLPRSAQRWVRGGGRAPAGTCTACLLPSPPSARPRTGMCLSLARRRSLLSGAARQTCGRALRPYPVPQPRGGVPRLLNACLPLLPPRRCCWES